MPPPKDRLAAMQQNADIQPGDDCEVGMDDEGPLKDFFKEMEEIKANCEKVNTKVAEVKKLQSEILNNPTVDKKQNQQMDDLMAEIKKLANNVRTRMKKIEQENETEEKARGEVTNEIRIKKTQHTAAGDAKQCEYEYGVHESSRNFFNRLRMINSSDWTHLGKEGGDNNECLVDTRQRH